MASAALASGVCLESLVPNARFTGANWSVGQQRSSIGIARASSPFLGFRVRQSVPLTRRNERGLNALRVEAAAAGVSVETKEKGSVVVIDNYDSFTYNLCQYLGDLGCKIDQSVCMPAEFLCWLSSDGATVKPKTR